MANVCVVLRVAIRFSVAMTASLEFGLAVGLAVGCGGAQSKSCRASNGCESSQVCVIGKCVAETSVAPVPATARRVVIAPESIAFVSSSGRDHAQPAIAPLGAAVGERARILVRFARGGWSRESVLKAYLVLDRAEGAQAGPGEVVLRADRVVEPWTPKDGAGVSWASAPASEAIEGARVAVLARAAGAIRIDVTRYAIDLANKRAHAYGLRVEAKGEGYGVPIATGWGQGSGPRLEVYLR